VGGVLALAALLLAADPSAAGTATLRSRLASFRPVEDLGYAARRPFHLDAPGRHRVASVVWAAFAGYAGRHAVRDAIWDGPEGHRIQAAETARDLLGKGLTAPVLAAGFGTAYAFTHDRRERDAAELLLESAALSASLAGVGQFVLASERPRDGDDVNFLRTGGHGVSADTALAASIVSPIRRSYLMPREGESRGAALGRRTAVAALYAGAALVAVQRMDSDAHWLPDVTLGLAAGLASGSVLCDARGLRGARVGLLPCGGVGLSWRW
jgi:hypothetical protein